MNKYINAKNNIDTELIENIESKLINELADQIRKEVDFELIYGFGNKIFYISDMTFRIITHISDKQSIADQALLWLESQNKENYNLSKDNSLNNFYTVKFLDKQLAMEFKLRWM